MNIRGEIHEGLRGLRKVDETREIGKGRSSLEIKDIWQLVEPKVVQVRVGVEIARDLGPRQERERRFTRQ